MKEIMMDFNKLDQLKATLDAHRPFPTTVVENLHENLIVEWTYNSNAIEGNTLTLQETKVALEGITVGGKTLREHFEAVGHKEAILFIEELVKDDALLSEHDIKSIHSLILKNIDEENAGKYRQHNVIISGAEHRPVPSLEVPAKMEEFITWYKTDAMQMHPVERAARVHVDFVGIHPFVDGNGRTSRLLMNLELMKSGFPSAVLKVEDRLAYYKALDLAHTTGDYEPFIKIVCDVTEKSFEPYFYALGLEYRETR